MYTYHFSIPRVLCGKFIGVRGCVIKELKAATNCNLIVNNRPHQNSNSRIDKNSDHNESQVSFFICFQYYYSCRQLKKVYHVLMLDMLKNTLSLDFIAVEGQDFVLSLECIPNQKKKN